METNITLLCVYISIRVLQVSSVHAIVLQVFGEVLSKNTALKQLDMSFNAIGKHGARFLANGLASNTTLEVRYR